MKKNFSTVVIALIFFIGLSVLLYPLVSGLLNKKNAIKVINQYKDEVSKLDENRINECFAEAEKYNEELAKRPLEFLNGNPKNEVYSSLLNISEGGIMGVIEIDKIGVKLPIYHGTSDEVLKTSVGHLEGSSLPVGGANTHSVLTGHRGLPSARLFTDLDKLEPGDTIILNVLNKSFAYRVSSITIVLPNEISNLNILKDQDLITLVTCTPYAVNTHRLLITCERTELQNHALVASNAVKINTAIVSAVIWTAVIIPSICIAAVIIKVKKRKE